MVQTMLTIQVVAGKVLESFVQQDNGQGDFHYNHPLRPAQGGYLEDELRGGKDWTCQ